MVHFVYKGVPKLQAVSKCIIRSWDSEFHIVVWQEQRRLACMGQTPDTSRPPLGYIQGLKITARWVLASSSTKKQQPVRSGSYELLVWLGDPEIRLAVGSLHFVMSKVMAECDPVHLRFDTWGLTETSTTWRGRLIFLLLRVEIGSGGVDIGIMEMLGQDELGSH